MAAVLDLSPTRLIPHGLCLINLRMKHETRDSSASFHASTHECRLTDVGGRAPTEILA